MRKKMHPPSWRRNEVQKKRNFRQGIFSIKQRWIKSCNLSGCDKHFFVSFVRNTLVSPLTGFWTRGYTHKSSFMIVLYQCPVLTVCIRLYLIQILRGFWTVHHILHSGFTFVVMTVHVSRLIHFICQHIFRDILNVLYKRFCWLVTIDCCIHALTELSTWK